MKSVKHILQDKGHNIWHTTPDTLVYDALKLMAEKGVGSLLVLDEGKLVGIISERDYARKVILQGKSSLDTPVKDIMTDKVICVSPEQTIEECMALMTDKHIRHLPVLVDEKVIGVVSIGDVVKAELAEKDFLIKQLKNYITGDR
ncbi:MAG: CBS domain-containing protein [Candidatus Methylomirabilales bacterium]